MNLKDDNIVSSGELLKKMFAHKGWNEKYSLMEIKTNWNEIVGDLLSNNTTPKNLYKNKLTITCNSSTWRNELSLRKELIIQSVNNFMRAKIVDEIEIR